MRVCTDGRERVGSRLYRSVLIRRRGLRGDKPLLMVASGSSGEQTEEPEESPNDSRLKTDAFRNGRKRTPRSRRCLDRKYTIPVLHLESINRAM